MLTIGGLRRASRERLSKVLRQAKGSISPADASRALNVEQPEAADEPCRRAKRRGWRRSARLQVTIVTVWMTHQESLEPPIEVVRVIKLPVPKRER